jgi:hypothetical protein
LNAAQLALLVGASALAGAVNSVAGGGTLLSFPAALAVGLPPIVANVTNSVALAPASLAAAWAYRRELAVRRRLALVLLGPALIGAAGGAILLVRTPERTFEAIVPWLVLGATLLVGLKDAVARFSKEKLGAHDETGRELRGPTGAVVLVCQLLVGVYGGYFGAGQGIVMLAFLAFVVSSIHEMNAIKSFLAAAVNGFSSLYFVVTGVVDVRVATVMAAGAIAGALGGASLARRAKPRFVQSLVLLLGLGLTGVLAYRRWG